MQKQIPLISPVSQHNETEIDFVIEKAAVLAKVNTLVGKAEYPS